MQNKLTRRIIILILGLVLMGIGGASLIATGIGADAILVFIQGFANLTGFKLGTTILLMNGLLTIVLFFVNKKLINIGTLAVILLVGPIVNFVEGLGIHPDPLTLTTLEALIRHLVAGIIVTFGIALYMYANIGYSPFEGILITIKDKLHVRFAIVKIVHDAILFTFGWLLGGTFGIGSIITIFMFGPLIDFYLQIFKKTKIIPIEKASY